ncbi:DUF547 domain-containing protein [Hyunsoonleella sp. SJ7]|uniref:DUF547 domain-containing protein n=1 Tax=Hyunsoonleella aquatilis TaxID=2762758 RepID=A0A923KJV7_9FLAO|nr:DUF547 domain-containing protein [Hyunsoonleella aquatilis]MBC3757118.1 DUF547 domain-containing protein [Hyunsoonleella aquatilis]
MKYLLIFVFLVLMISCSGTKKTVAKAPSTSAPKPSISSDTLQSPSTDIPEIIDSLDVNASEKHTEIIEESIQKDDTDSANFSHSTFNDLLQKHVSELGNVNYQGFKSDRKSLNNYIKELDKNLPNNNTPKQEKLAYWINAYNAMTVDLILRHYPVKSIKDIKNPWKQRHWKLGEKWYNLDEIEHQILRKMDEPRIHFAIVCASYSCPKLQNEAFTASNLEKQLTKATKDFLSDSERNIISENRLELSKIFQWFGKDFKQNGSLIDFLNTYSEVGISKEAKIRFKDYNWDLNE